MKFTKVNKTLEKIIKAKLIRKIFVEMFEKLFQPRDTFLQTHREKKN